ncbi:acyl-CoA dehydrogenase family protein [Micromonospora sp. RTGN7]|uniref:acyl-CoA dehydrogenase family protein n=1 Tax=Micromonospora sp. RTGN7 TaxID=3016526 RepID=UPI0029FEEBDB|nr:acyl-CoA dehydrogenase family protein [Micromonospora sp. RTGN7]
MIGRRAVRQSEAGPVLDLAAALAAVDQIAPTLLEQAPKADRAAAFPEQSLAALRQAGLLSAGIPREYGGHGFTTAELGEIALRLGNLCGSTAMIWAMHQIQVVCMVPSARQEPRLAEYLAQAAREQLLIGSVTSEKGVGGSLRTSRAAVLPVGGGGVQLTKSAPTVSYGEAADSLLVTARREPDAAAGDQVLVLVTARQAQLRPTGGWDTLGMRGTCSGPQELTARVPAWQVLPQPFSEIAAGCMVPLSHALWSAVWCGIAEDALRRSIRFVQIKLRGGTAAPNPQLGWMYARLRTMTDAVRQFATSYDRDPGAADLNIRANALKMQVSTDSVGVAMMALEVCGMAGYSETGDFSVSRQLRDLLSGRLMISNDRLNLTTSELVAFGDVL